MHRADSAGREDFSDSAVSALLSSARKANAMRTSGNSPWAVFQKLPHSDGFSAPDDLRLIDELRRTGRPYRNANDRPRPPNEP